MIVAPVPASITTFPSEDAKIVKERTSETRQAGITPVEIDKRLRRTFESHSIDTAHEHRVRGALGAFDDAAVERCGSIRQHRGARWPADPIAMAKAGFTVAAARTGKVPSDFHLVDRQDIH